MICTFKAIHYHKQIYLGPLDIYVLKYMNLTLLIFCTAPGLVWKVALKRTKVKLGLLANINMLSLIEKGIIGRILSRYLVICKR